MSFRVKRKSGFEIKHFSKKVKKCKTVPFQLLEQYQSLFCHDQTIHPKEYTVVVFLKKIKKIQ